MPPRNCVDGEVDWSSVNVRIGDNGHDHLHALHHTPFAQLGCWVAGTTFTIWIRGMVQAARIFLTTQEVQA